MNHARATDTQIDRMVYDLYGLTEDEIQIVEGSGKPLHVVAACDEANGSAFIITAYEPSLEGFESDYRTNKNENEPK